MNSSAHKREQQERRGHRGIVKSAARLDICVGSDEIESEISNIEYLGARCTVTERGLLGLLCRVPDLRGGTLAFININLDS